MVMLDYLVLAGYFVLMIGIGVYASRLVKEQEDFFMGGRSFGKLLQTFAAFGAGTGPSDPVITGRTTFTSGMSGMWSVMYWLFVTPFYWIAGVWYRRMRHLTLGDWFVERYESKALGAAYCIFGISFYMVYGSMFFSAIGKVAAPLIESDTVMLGGQAVGIQYVLVPFIGVVVLVYGLLGGLRAAYMTDLIQGLCIILLSIILIPYGLNALVVQFGDPQTDSMLDGFRYMHEQLPKEHFSVIGSTSTSEFPLHRIVAIVIINLVGIVVQPHFIATGGGSAKTENNARIGLVVGNFLKRFCTVGWVLTALIALALYANDPELVLDPGKTWGVASRNLLGPGLTGLMLACLLAALMSSVDAYMIVGSALVVRNIYAPYINKTATEAEYVRVARMTGAITVGGAVIVSLFYMDVFEQLKLTWVFNILFAAPFWVGMYWRRATAGAAWATVVFNVLIFFGIPFMAPRLMPQLQDNKDYLVTTRIVQTTTKRDAAPSDVLRRETEITEWEKANAVASPELEAAEQEYRGAATLLRESTAANEASDELLGSLQRATARLSAARAVVAKLADQPKPLVAGDEFVETKTSGGKSVFWPDGVKPVDRDGQLLLGVKPQKVGDPTELDARTTQQILAYDETVKLRGYGDFQIDYLLYRWAGVNWSSMTDATLDTLSLPPKIIMPFLVMILFSLITPRNSKESLDRYYSKMKTPVVPDHEQDRKNLEEAFANVEALEARKLFPGTSLEFQRPTKVDIIGVIVCFVVCFGIIGLAVAVAGIGG
ncbi:MAG: sodium:solute symporter family protein [Planctomycetota bacterium]|nr:sodium:solute symporter family protein [Planctomycetota bacterium]